MSKLIILSDGLKSFYCPGCRMHHGVDDRWNFNGDFDKPTFSPSIKVTAPYMGSMKPYICHSFVTDGKIQFLTDCNHELAGQTIEMVDEEI